MLQVLRQPTDLCAGTTAGRTSSPRKVELVAVTKLSLTTFGLFTDSQAQSLQLTEPPGEFCAPRGWFTKLEFL